MADISRKIALAVIPRLVAWLGKCWFASCRIEPLGEENWDRAIDQGNVVAAFWHYSFLYIFFHPRCHSAAVMVSASKDGEFIARLSEYMGHVPVRGSSNRGGLGALKKMIRAAKEGYNCSLVADGSQGPARKAQAGAILLASKTGLPVCPVTWACSRTIQFNSWDKTLVPLPFSKIVFACGEAFQVPKNISSDELEHYRQELENRLNTLYDQAWAKLGLGAHDV